MPNVYVVLTARGLNEKLFITACASAHMLDQSLEGGVIIANKTIGQIDLRRHAGTNILAVYDGNDHA